MVMLRGILSLVTPGCLVACLLYWACLQPVGLMAASAPPTPVAETDLSRPLLQLGVGDELKLEVFGQPDMTTSLYVTDDGTVSVPLIGVVKVVGLSSTQASRLIEKALSDGNYLVNPYVTLTVLQSRSQRVSVLGEVGTPGRYTIDSGTSIFALLAQAGGVTPAGADTINIVRTNANGEAQRLSVSLRGLSDSTVQFPVDQLRSGDVVFVPKAEQFYIVGEVNQAGAYPIEAGMTVLKAIALAGGITQLGSLNRVKIKRKVSDSKYKTFSADISEKVQVDDVVQVRQSIF